jgi:hypothetical protein
VYGALRSGRAYGGLAFIAAAVALSRGASAQTAPQVPASPALPSPPLQIQLAAPEGVILRIRPEFGEGYSPAAFVKCPPTCRLAVYAGRYRLEGDPADDSGLRRVASTFDLASDALIEVVPGSRPEYEWGLGLTIAGGVVLGLATMFSLSRQSGATENGFMQPIPIALMGVGIPLTVGGIYLLVRSRNRVTLEDPWRMSTVPTTPPSGAQIEIGARF